REVSTWSAASIAAFHLLDRGRLKSKLSKAAILAALQVEIIAGLSRRKSKGPEACRGPPALVTLSGQPSGYCGRTGAPPPGRTPPPGGPKGACVPGWP